MWLCFGFSDRWVCVYVDKTKLQTLLAAMELLAALLVAVDEEEADEEDAAEAEDAAAAAADAAADVAAEKCCAKVDTSELLPLAAPVDVVPDPDPDPAPAAFFDMPAFEDSESEEVEDCDPNGEEAISAAAAEFAPPPYVAAEDEAEELAAAEASEDEAACESEDRAEADELELVDEDDGEEDVVGAPDPAAPPAVASGGERGVFRPSNLAFSSSTLLNLNRLPVCCCSCC